MILPCPFCGAQPTIQRLELSPGAHYIIRCVGPYENGAHAMFEGASPAEVTALWNTRSAELLDTTSNLSRTAWTDHYLEDDMQRVCRNCSHTYGQHIGEHMCDGVDSQGCDCIHFRPVVPPPAFSAARVLGQNVESYDRSIDPELLRHRTLAVDPTPAILIDPRSLTQEQP